MFRLNQYAVANNGMAGAHDPSMLYDPVTKRYYSYGTDIYGPPLGLPDAIGIPIRSSANLVDFQYKGLALSPEAIAEGRDNGAFPPTVNFWAPYVEYVRGEYRMYYSATRAFGSSESRIWLAVAQNPLGPFENRGVVADTWGTDDTYPNAIDAHVIWNGERCYLVYGSFFGGIYLKELDPETGLAKSGDAKELGVCISRKGPNSLLDGPEGAAIQYVPETGYYYLFQSYGWLGENYDIRVGRSDCVTGPYVDRQGRNLMEETLGDKLAGSYRFQGDAPGQGQDEPDWRFGGFYGPGHGVPLYDPVGKRYFFVHHIRDGAAIHRVEGDGEHPVSYQKHYMMVRPMFFLDGWPTLGPEPYDGAAIVTRPLSELRGREVEVLTLPWADNSQQTSVMGSGDAVLDRLTSGVCYDSWDFETGKNRTVFTGFDKFGVVSWGKLRYNDT